MVRFLPFLVCFLTVSSLSLAQTQGIDIRGNAVGLIANQQIVATGITIQQVTEDDAAQQGFEQLIVVFGSANNATFEQSIVVPDGLPLRAARTILERYGEEAVDTDPDRIAQLLEQKAKEHQDFVERLALQPRDNSEIGALLQDAQLFVEQGNYVSANTLFVQARQLLIQREQERENDKQRIQAQIRADTLELAVFWGFEGEADRLMLNYIQAAQSYLQAAQVVQELPDATAEALHWLVQAQTTYYLDGVEFGRNMSLMEAIKIGELALRQVSRDEAPFQWADIQGDIGNTLSTLGEREPGTARLIEAVAVYYRLLEVFTEERSPLQWAETQNNLGTTLQRIGERRAETHSLKQAVAAYRNALKVFSEESTLDDWAITQTNLGTVLVTLGERELGTERFEEAINVYRKVLEVQTRESARLEWAITTASLGVALQSLGDKEPNIERLEEAVTTFHNALEVLTMDRAPLHWATTQSNLGNALSSLGEFELDSARLEEALIAYHNALRVRNQVQFPLDWAETKYNLGITLVVLDELSPQSTLLNEAEIAYRDALRVLSKETDPKKWAATQHNLGHVLLTLGERETSGTHRFEEAAIAFRNALEVSTQESNLSGWARTSYWYATTLVRLERYSEAAEQIKIAGIYFPDEALAFFDDLSEKSGKDSVVLLHYGDLYLALNERDAARETWRNALSRNPDPGLALELEAKLLALN